jgi:hypothetical protein
MGSQGERRGGKKQRKFGRFLRQLSNKNYKFRRAKNKMRKLLKHIKKFPKDTQATGTLSRWKQKGVPKKLNSSVV